MDNLWANIGYNNDYVGYLEQMLDSGFDATTMAGDGSMELVKPPIERG
ncbi:MAG: hypothetical protein V2I67_08910 [Thermoanaerobaculales bacterium]|jgi:hypothetical protein|nr:hypothetical protein [Thermoanaerobaculales bacterium]